MNITTKSTFFLAAVYIGLSVALVNWMETELRAATRSMMVDTAALIGGEVSDALRNVSVEQLIGGDWTMRQHLRTALDTVTRQSSVYFTLSVVDRDGRVVASDDDVLVGKRLAAPNKEFGKDRNPHLISTFTGLLDAGTHLLLAPVFKNNAPVGYIQMDISNRAMARVYEGIYWRLGLLALVGLTVILSVSIWLHLRLSRLQKGPAVMFDSSRTGRAVAEPSLDGNTAANGFLAQRWGRELHDVPAGEEFERDERDVLAKVFEFGTLLLSPRAELEFASEAAQNLLTGGKPAELAAQFALIRAPLETVAKSLHSSGLPSRNLDLCVAVGGTTRRFRMEVYAMDQHNPHCMFVIIRDQDMIDELEKDLRAAARFNGLATLYVGAAHDLRGPLNSMVVYLELLKQSLRRSAPSGSESGETVQQNKYIDVIQQEIYRLNSYVQALLDLTAPAKNIRSDMDLGLALTEIAGLIRVQAKLQGVTLEWQLPDKPLRLRCQQVQLRQAFLNIIINALEAMPSGGVLTVRATARDFFIVVEVCDTGAGIPESLQPRIFDLHFTTKEGRTGIGLYVTRSVMAEHGGTLDVSSKLGCGACFSVRLPGDQQSVEAANPAPD